MIASTE